MSTIQFQCGQCGNQMKVGPELLGQKVRCPHCKQVVLAPAALTETPVPASTPEGPGQPDLPMPEPAETREPESTGTAPENADSFLGDFGAAARAERPGEGGWPNLQLEESPGSDSPPAGDLAHAPAGDFPQEASLLGGQAGSEAPTGGTEDTSAFSQEGGEGFAGEPANQEEPAPSRHPEHSSGGINFLLAALLVFLIPYAIVVTVAAVFFYHLKEKVPQGFEAMPDVQGDDPGASHNPKPGTTTHRDVPDAPLPAKLRVPLGGNLQLGDLEVQPVTIEQTRIVIKREHDPFQSADLSDHPALALTLKLRNVSQDDYFVPTDPIFNRRWVAGKTMVSAKPYDFLEVGDERFFGGPCDFRPPGSDNPQEYVEGEEFHKLLPPGETMATKVFTDPNKPEILKAVHHFPGTMLWRVELRRGLIHIHGREYPACAVIGVEFTARDIVPK